MKKLWVLLIFGLILFVGSMLVGILFQLEIQQFFLDLGWNRWAGFFSGTWWQSVPPWILAFLGVLTFTITVQQIRQARLSTNAQMALGLFNELRSPESRKRLRKIYSENRDSFTEFKFDMKSDDIDALLDNLGMVGALVAHGILDEKLAIVSFGGVTVIRCWYQFEGYIKKLRLQRGLQCGSYFEDFACRALKYWKHKKKNWILSYREISDTPFNLVERLYKDKKLMPKRINKQLTIEEIKNEISKKEKIRNNQSV